MANISNIINVQLLSTAAAVADDNMNVVAIITSEQTALSTAKRYGLYKDLASVATDFGTNSAAYAHASIFFSQQPNPTTSGGVLVMAYWRSANETVAASAGKNVGGQIAETTLLDALQAITAGSFDIDIDGTTENIASLDFSTSTSMTDVIGVLNAALSGGTASYDSATLRITITSDTTGVTSLVTFATVASSGTDVSTLLSLNDGSGAALTAGLASAVLSAETKLAAITEIKSQISIKGYSFIDSVSDADRLLLAAFSQANFVLGYETYGTAAALEVNATNNAWQIKLLGYTYYRMLYSAANNRKLSTAYMSRNHVVNFNAENTALTMNLKELKGITPETYTQTVVTKAKRVGLDIYTTVDNKDKAVLLTSGANDFVDNVYNLISFIDSVQTAGFNVLAGTATKIPQTTKGVNQLVDSVEKVCERYFTVGFIAAGTWTSPDSFGTITVFNRNIEANGFYVQAGKLSDQSTASRDDRESPVIQIAIKNAGAIHSADFIIRFNK